MFLRPRLCLRLPSDSTSQWTPLSLASGSHYQAHNGLSPSSCCPCWAHTNKKETPSGVSFLFRNSAYAKFIPQLETCHLKLISHYPYRILSLLLSKYCSYPFIRLMFAYKFKAIAFNIILNFIKAPFYKSRN